MQHDPDAIEVVLGLPGEGKDGPNDLIFASTQEGYQIDEVSLESLSNQSGGNNSNSSGAAAARRMSEDFPIEDLEEEGVPNGGRGGKAKYTQMEMAAIPAEGKQID